jgi:hypothetical protein
LFLPNQGPGRSVDHFLAYKADVRPLGQRFVAVGSGVLAFFGAFFCATLRLGTGPAPSWRRWRLR